MQSFPVNLQLRMALIRIGLQLRLVNKKEMLIFTTLCPVVNEY